jgi:SAM-dependent methyltransferase
MTSAIEYWKNQIESHHAQSEKLQAETSWSSGDFWRPFSQFFRQDPRRTDDLVLDRLYPRIGPDSTVLDVGGGAGRMALPLALRCRHVTVVEPSDSMVEQLEEVAKESGITNVSVVRSTWEDAKVEPADIVLCAHVLYGVADAASFIRKLEAHAREQVIILAFMQAPISRFSVFWKPVHGEERIDMPGLDKLLPLLWEMDIYPDAEMFAPDIRSGFKNREEALEQLRQRIYVKPGTEQDTRLKQAMNELLIDSPNGLSIKGIKPTRQGLLSWKPQG